MKDGAGISKNLQEVSGETDCYGKQASELGSVTFEERFLIGTLNKVTEYTGFSSVAEEQTGYYLPFLYDGTDTLKMYVKSAEKQVTVDKSPTVNVVYLGADKATAEKAVLHLVKEDGAMTEVYMTGITFNEGDA
ncbi:hypothetical protein [Amedibacterium intestinale]|jgi:hypothetical protein|uniref:hypothetical protein n=1 Tax=Amedibacterium intestinale TaxID=2583452 RepID=UPI000E4E8E10|nr:hypothetical protein [Amedibacterium intestinale]MBS5370900.1 hypothetical protein [Coprobacillus cateniformis]RHO23794.1 hypothetical protein DW220_01950 [Eubacterium sp. AM18-26]RHO27888.1 hypothetical protein DW212_02485 [Eubacterium sp. AM18-10LB-B]DAU93648.1 MAG TPA: hypothetical protein [Caudoviricetes sp.]